jgi:hypothetical protein
LALQAEDGAAGRRNDGQERDDRERFVGDLTDREDVVDVALFKLNALGGGEGRVVVALDIEAVGAGVDVLVVGRVALVDAREPGVAAGDLDVDRAGVRRVLDEADARLAWIDRVEVDLVDVDLDVLERIDDRDDVRLARVGVEILLGDRVRGTWTL